MPLLADALSASSLAGTALLGVCAAYHAGTLVCALRWRRESRAVERQGAARISEWPGVTVLKPIRGIDPGHDDNLRSFCEQDYPDYEVIFGALDAGDPGLEAVRRLQRAMPDCRIQIAAGGEVRGWNRKVSTLLAMMPHACTTNDLVVIADSDMRVRPDYLRRVVASISQQDTGLVTCPYRGAHPDTAAGVLEALGIGTDFIPSAFLAYYAFRVRLAFGSTIAIRRSVLEEIGGFEALVDVLADDHALADRTSRAGYGVGLAAYVVDDMLGAEPWVSVWRRRLRWARTARALSPGPYYGLFVTYLTPIAILAAGLLRFDATARALLLSAIGFRLAIAAAIAAICTRDRSVLRWIPLVPVSEVVSAAIWAVSLLGREIHWRGEAFVVRRDGTLTRDDR